MNVEEAKNHQCPLCISFTEQGLSKSGLKITDYVYANCIADRCMAWRWNYEDMVIAETIGGEKIFANGKTLMSETDGYCGLAGKEEAK